MIEIDVHQERRERVALPKPFAAKDFHGFCDKLNDLGTGNPFLDDLEQTIERHAAESVADIIDNPHVPLFKLKKRVRGGQGVEVAIFSPAERMPIESSGHERPEDLGDRPADDAVNDIRERNRPETPARAFANLKFANWAVLVPTL
jgi:hypothetical protein